MFFRLRYSQELIQSGEYEKAIYHLKQIEEAEPESSELAMALAKAYRGKNDTQKSEFYYKRALDKNPNHEWALIEYSELLEKMNRPEESIKYLERAKSSAKNTQNIIKIRNRLDEYKNR